MSRIVIGSRGSRLALVQSEWIAEQVRRKNPGLEVEIRVIKTTGDKMSTASLVALAADAKGLFVKEIEEALLAGEVDLAVHSLKDVPTELPEGLTLGPTPVREDPRDALVSLQPLSSLAELRKGARVATSSLRRKIQLHHQRPDCEVVPIRGNVDTRVAKLGNEGLEGVLLAAAGLNRLGLLTQLNVCPLPVDQMVPAIGQGALALELRESDGKTAQLVAALDDAPSREAIDAERKFLQRMGGGCQVPMGAHASVSHGICHFSAFVADPQGRRFLSRAVSGSRGALADLVDEVASQLEAEGAAELLRNGGVL